MFGTVAARGAAMVLLVVALVAGGRTAAFAQYQIDRGAITVSALVPAQPPIQAPALPEPFGLATVAVSGGGLVAKWTGVVAEIDTEKAILQHCRDNGRGCPPAAQKFLAVIADGRAHEGRARIGVINRAINLAIRPTSDLVQWGVPDRWSAPLATLTSGRGDCEDYAIAKYVALREAGLAASDVRLVIVRDLASGSDHAITAARTDGKWIVLDNRRLTLVEDDDLPHALPLFVLDMEGVKEFAPMVAQARPAPAASATPAPSPSALGF